jgi:hypothetical protein
MILVSEDWRLSREAGEKTAWPVMPDEVRAVAIRGVGPHSHLTIRTRANCMILMMSACIPHPGCGPWGRVVLRARKIPHTARISPGGHEPEYWRKNIRISLPHQARIMFSLLDACEASCFTGQHLEDR